MGKSTKQTDKQTHFSIDIKEAQPRAVPDATYVAPHKSIVATGIDPFKTEPSVGFQGYIIFSHGYLSDPQKNPAGSINAMRNKDPGKADYFTLKGENANEHNWKDPEDTYTQRELNQDLPDKPTTTKDMEAAKEHVDKLVTEDKIPESRKGGTLSFYDYEKYWGYWNMPSNQFNGSNLYAGYFNATGNEYFLNGSHGLGSDAAERIDHGIVLGYQWAKENWGIISKKDFDELQESSKPIFLRDTPAYKPVTHVNHSQGNALGLGASLGILYYAHELGWDRIPMNIVLLAIHQPIKLTGKEYDDMIYMKTKYYDIGYALPVFWRGKSRGGTKYIDSLAHLFETAHNKLNHEEGINEHMARICNGWPTLAKRAVQFTFTNDHGDPVIRDGDIPGIDSACDPETDSSLYSAELFLSESEYPIDYDSQRKKKIPLYNSHNRILGYLSLPPFIANQRIEFTDDGKEQIWEDYEYIATEWGKAWARYKRVLHTFQSITKGEYKYYDFKKTVNSYVLGVMESTLLVILTSPPPLAVRHPIATMAKNVATMAAAPLLGKASIAAIDIKAADYIEMHGVDNWLETHLGSQELYQYVMFNIGIPSKKEANKLTYDRLKMALDICFLIHLMNYAALQSFDLYAHFATVALVSNPHVLSDWKTRFGAIDSVGTTESIWSRFIKRGHTKFYKIDLDIIIDDAKLGKRHYPVLDLNVELHKTKISTIEQDKKSFQIETSIAVTHYIKKIIQKHQEDKQLGFIDKLKQGFYNW